MWRQTLLRLSLSSGKPQEQLLQLHRHPTPASAKRKLRLGTAKPFGEKGRRRLQQLVHKRLQRPALPRAPPSRQRKTRMPTATQMMCNTPRRWGIGRRQTG